MKRLKWLTYTAIVLSLCFFAASCSKPAPEPSSQGAQEGSESAPADTAETKPDQTADAGEKEMVTIEIELPKPMFVGTPQNIRVPNLEPPRQTARPPFLAPKGTMNVASGMYVESTDDMPIFGEIDMITDGDKNAGDGSFVELGPGIQHITIDLEAMHNVYAVLVWHYHLQPRVYFDVVVQLADDPDFTQNVRTIYNNDHDNSLGLGVGTDNHYVETSEGRLIDAKGYKAQYVRLYSNGNTSDDLNHYIEVEVYGIPVE